MPDYVPLQKRGFTGIWVTQKHVYASVWDRIVLFEKPSGKIVKVITHPHFSDIHDLFMENDTLWVVNTNVDGIYRVDQQYRVTPAWYAWQQPGLTPKTFDGLPDNHYALLEKTAIPYHQLHLNGLWMTPNHIFLSYLGTPATVTPWKRWLWKTRLKKRKYMTGGIIVLNRKWKCVQHLRTEGVHAPFPEGDVLHFPAYFGKQLISIDTKTLRPRSVIPVDPGKEQLVRGGIATSKALFLGTTMHRGWEKQAPFCYIHRYRQPTGAEVWLSVPDTVGIYQIKAYESGTGNRS